MELFIKRRHNAQPRRLINLSQSLQVQQLPDGSLRNAFRQQAMKAPHFQPVGKLGGGAATRLLRNLI